MGTSTDGGSNKDAEKWMEIKICNPHNWMDGEGEGSVKIDSLDSGLHNWRDGGTA